MATQEFETPTTRLIIAGVTQLKFGKDVFQQRLADLKANDIIQSGRNTYAYMLAGPNIVSRVIEETMFPKVRARMKKLALREMAIGLVKTNPLTTARKTLYEQRRTELEDILKSID